MGSLHRATRGRDGHRQWAHFTEPLEGETGTGNGLTSPSHSRAPAMGSLHRATRGRDGHRQWAHFTEPLEGETGTGNGLTSPSHSRERRAPDNADLTVCVVERTALATDALQLADSAVFASRPCRIASRRSFLADRYANADRNDLYLSECLHLRPPLVVEGMTTAASLALQHTNWQGRGGAPEPVWPRLSRSILTNHGLETPSWELSGDTESLRQHRSCDTDDGDSGAADGVDGDTGIEGC